MEDLHENDLNEEDLLEPDSPEMVGQGESQGSQTLKISPANVNAQLSALFAVLSDINEMTSSLGFKDIMQMKKELISLRSENEKLKKENKVLAQQVKQKDKEIVVLSAGRTQPTQVF